jgi:hypothetical protein
VSYDIRLKDPATQEVLMVGHHTHKGGTYALGGSSLAEHNITYNYSSFYFETIDPKLGIGWLYGKTGAETLGVLKAAVERLGTEQDPDYWKATRGNAGHALIALIDFASARPDGVWDGD